MNRVLVIGASGNVGSQVISQLSAMNTSVRALTRNPETARLPGHVDVVRGDLTVPETLDACLDGMEAVFLVWTAPTVTAGAVLERIARHAQRVVLLSSPHKTPHPLFQQPNPLRAQHAQIEQLVERSGVQWTILRPGMFSANARNWWAPQIRAGNIVRWPFGAVPTAPIHERDIAAVAVRSLCEDGHAGAEYVLTGPESLSQAGQVYAIGHAIGRNLQFEEISPAEARRELLTLMPAFVIEMLLDAWAAALGQPALITSTVESVTGAPGLTFLQWSKEHASEFHA
jgi:uncharacterized protein YbjT (DUF2867 family)